VYRRHRVVLVGVLLVALFGLGVAAEATYDDRWPYPSEDKLASNYDQHVGEETLLFGTVVRNGDSGAVIEVGYETGSFEMTVRNFEVSVQPGGSVQVYGTLAAGYTIDAKRVTVVNPSAGSDLYKYAISAVAAGLFLVVFFRYWRIDVRNLRLEGRDG